MSATIRSLAMFVGCCVVLASGCGRPGGFSTAVAQSSSGAPVPSIASLAGSWSGGATIVVDWIQQKDLSVQIQIDSDGKVTGKVGDATLADAAVRYSRSSFERSMGWGRDFRIHGKLQGDFVAAEKVYRDGVDIVFDQAADSSLVGGLATTGWEVGPRDKMKVSIGRMILRKPAGSTTRPGP